MGRDATKAAGNPWYGIPFRRVCAKCYERIMTTTGYDGVKYDERDENLDADY